MSWTMVDGVLLPSSEATVPADDPAVTLGYSVFETLAWPGGQLDLHLDRLEYSCSNTFIDMPDRALLQREVEAVCRELGVPARVRITLTGGGHRLVRAEALDTSRKHRAVRAVRGPYVHEPVLGGRTKHGSRLPWVVAVKRSQVDEVLLERDDGVFVEGTTSAIVAVIGGTLVTAPEGDGLLASTTIQSVLVRADQLGVPVERAFVPSRGPWDGLYIASATRDLAPVVELDGQSLPGWEPVGQSIAAIG